MADSPQLAAAKRLLDAAKQAGFAFERIAPGEDGPLRGVRQTPQWHDELYLAGFSRTAVVHRDPAPPLIAGRTRWTPSDGAGL